MTDNPQAAHEAAMKAAISAFQAEAFGYTDEGVNHKHIAMCRAYLVHLAPLVFAAGAEAMRERAAEDVERWHVDYAQDMAADIRALPIPVMEKSNDR